MSGPPFNVDFTMTVDDVVAYVRLLQRRLNAIGVVLGLAVMGMGAILAALSADLFTGLWTFVIGLLFVLFAGTEFLDRWRVRRSARSLIGSKATFTFDEAGITADTVTGSGKVSWSAVTQMVRNDKVLVIKRDRIPVVWIPSRIFATAADADALADYVSDQIAAAHPA